MTVTIFHAIGYKFKYSKFDIPMKKFFTLLIFSGFFVSAVNGQTFLAHPQNTTVCEGESVTFSAFYLDAAVGVSARWTFDGATIAADGTTVVGPNGETVSTNNYTGGNALLTLTIQGTVTASMANDIVVEVLDITPAVVATSNTATLTITAAPAVTTGPAASNGTSLTDNCTNDDVDIAVTVSSGNIQWQRKDGTNDWADMTVLMTRGGSSVTSATVQIDAGANGNDDEDDYRVKVTSIGCPDVFSNSVELEVLADLAISNNFTGGTINPGNTASFIETFTNTNSTTEYTWTVAGTILDNNADNITLIGDGASLMFDNVNIGGLHVVDITCTTTNVTTGVTTDRKSVV